MRTKAHQPAEAERDVETRRTQLGETRAQCRALPPVTVVVEDLYGRLSAELLELLPGAVGREIIDENYLFLQGNGLNPLHDLLDGGSFVVNRHHDG